MPLQAKFLFSPFCPLFTNFRRMPPGDDQIKQIAERIGPHLNECNVQAFVMCGYIADANGVLSRMIISGAPSCAEGGTNLACHDGLRQIERLSNLWASGQL